MSNISGMLIELADAFGPAGFEKEAREVFEKHLPKTAQLSYDNLGSIIAELPGKVAGPRVLLAAHLDEVGLMVRGILPGGQLRFVPLGSWWAPTLLAQRLLVRTRQGDRLGVIGAKPPHFLKEDEKNKPLKLEELYLDVGTSSAAETEALGFAPGDCAVPAVSATAIGPEGTYCGKAFDDRAGCAVLLQALQELKGDHPNTVFAAGTVQEEGGLKGARTVANLVKPDIAIILEGTPADDLPEMGPIVQGRLGGGPQLRWRDGSMIAHRGLTEFAGVMAKELQIPYQMAVREGGGTDAAKIQLAHGGVPVLVIGVPVRHIHSHQSIVRLGDLEVTVKLVKALVMGMDEKRVEEVKKGN
jgi:putative aminopeptidase FrvX